MCFQIKYLIDQISYFKSFFLIFNDFIDILHHCWFVNQEIQSESLQFATFFFQFHHFSPNLVKNVLLLSEELIKFPIKFNSIQLICSFFVLKNISFHFLSNCRRWTFCWCRRGIEGTFDVIDILIWCVFFWSK